MPGLAGRIETVTKGRPSSRPRPLVSQRACRRHGHRPLPARPPLPDDLDSGCFDEIAAAWLVESPAPPGWPPLDHRVASEGG
jgi:hypothetical protein